MDMNKVWFRNHDNQLLFVLNTCKEIPTVPMIGDNIKVSDKDFSKATFRVKPHGNIGIYLDFTVVSRTYSIPSKEWELICEPTPKSLLYLLQKVKI
jgi:hypothetical protein